MSFRGRGVCDIEHCEGRSSYGQALVWVCARNLTVRMPLDRPNSASKRFSGSGSRGSISRGNDRRNADQQTGSVTLLAKGFAESRVDLNLSGGTRSEIRNSNASPDEGNWIGSDSVVHAIALHNCFTDASWFFPALGSLGAVATNPNVVLTYVGLESSLQHIHVYTYNAQLPAAQQLSAMDFYLDPQTLLPQVVIFNEHPDDDQTVNIAVEVMFSDYRNVNGATIPFHIQRYVNNSLTLDVELTSSTVNSDISDTQFSVQ